MRKEVNHYSDAKWIGQKFRMLTVLESVHVIRSNGPAWYWRVRCDCGNERVVNPCDVVSGHTMSCGCYRKNKPSPTATHRESHTRLHDIWCDMNKRCDPKHSERTIARYGARGISVCDEWKEYIVFAEWARSHGYSDELTIDRIDVNGNYCPENCRWIPRSQQARNRRTTHWVEYKGETISLAEACEKAGLPYKQVFERITKGRWPVWEALSVPMGGKRISERKSISALAREHGLNPATVHSRLYDGWDLDRALNTPIKCV